MSRVRAGLIMEPTLIESPAVQAAGRRMDALIESTVELRLDCEAVLVDLDGLLHRLREMRR